MHSIINQIDFHQGGETIIVKISIGWLHSPLEVAQQRYKTSIETFLIGKINTLDLNDAQNAKDEARRKHISELYYYWYYFYQIRSLTLWDFQANTELELITGFRYWERLLSQAAL